MPAFAPRLIYFTRRARQDRARQGQADAASARRSRAASRTCRATRARSPRPADCCRTTRSASTPRASRSTRAAPPRPAVEARHDAVARRRVPPEHHPRRRATASWRRASCRRARPATRTRRPSRRPRPTAATALDVIRGFPAIVGDRFRHNRGFEDVAIQQFRGRTYLYTALQSPMENPGRAARDSLAIRVFRLDVTNASHPVVDREWVQPAGGQPGEKEAARRQDLGAVAGRVPTSC